MNTISNRLFVLYIAITAWVILSIGFSGVRVNQYNCDADYPIDYVIYTKWFCEIKEQSK